MRPLNIFFLISFIIIQSSFAATYLFTCKSNQVTLSLQNNITFDNSANGWKNYWGQIDYKVHSAGKEKSGTLQTYIMWRNDPRKEYNAFYSGLLENDEFQLIKSRNSGGSLGFAAIDSREPIRPKSKFKAKWALHKMPNELKELYLFPHELECTVH